MYLSKFFPVERGIEGWKAVAPMRRAGRGENVIEGDQLAVQKEPPRMCLDARNSDFLGHLENQVLTGQLITNPSDIYSQVYVLIYSGG